MSLSPQRTTHSTVNRQRHASRQMTAQVPRLMACELGNSPETSDTLSFIEALLGDG